MDKIPFPPNDGNHKSLLQTNIPFHSLEVQGLPMDTNYCLIQTNILIHPSLHSPRLKHLLFCIGGQAGLKGFDVHNICITKATNTILYKYRVLRQMLFNEGNCFTLSSF